MAERYSMVKAMNRAGARRARLATQRTAASERASRGGASIERRPLLPRGFVMWAAARLLAMLVLFGAGWLVYHASTSTDFQVRNVHVEGASLLSPAEVQQAAAVTGANLFWVDRGAIEDRLKQLPLVLRAEVVPVLPDTVTVRIVERKPAAFWVSGERAYVVDDQGVVLRQLGDDEAVYAAQPLPTIDQLDGQPLNAGDVVDASALATSNRLAALLPRAGVKPLAVEWSQDFGLEVRTEAGWRARFNSQGDIEQQVDSVRAIRDHLAKNKASVEVIDVRFGDRPYYR